MRSLGFSCALLLLAIPSIAGAHIRLNDPTARFVYTSTGQKTGPCGSGDLTGIVEWFMPGETITVQWSETINHPGHFRISLDPDGGDDDLVDPTDYNDFYVAPSVLADNIPDTGGNSFSQQITLPMIECEKCTLQLIQVMTDKPPWGPAGGDDIYYWCADIRISSTPPMTTSATTGAGPTGGTSAATGGGTGGGGGGDTSEEDGCSASGRVPGSPSVGLALVAALGLARRRRRGP